MSDTSLEFRAVQESATSFCMDWPVFESRESREIRFDGTVFVLDSEGVKVSHSSWDSPSDESADDALARIGWTRSGPWESDGFGRRTAPGTGRGRTGADPAAPAAHRPAGRGGRAALRVIPVSGLDCPGRPALAPGSRLAYCI